MPRPPPVTTAFRPRSRMTHRSSLGASARSTRRRTHVDVAGQSADILVAHPEDLEVVEQLAVVHPEPPPLRDARLVRLDLRRQVRVFEPILEQLLPVAELLHVDELVDDIEVDVAYLARPDHAKHSPEVRAIPRSLQGLRASPRRPRDQDAQSFL